MLRTAALALFDRLTSVAVGFALTWLAQSLHVVIDPSSETGLKALTVAVLAAVYDIVARLIVKRFPALAGFLGVTP